MSRLSYATEAQLLEHALRTFGSTRAAPGRERAALDDMLDALVLRPGPPRADHFAMSEATRVRMGRLERELRPAHFDAHPPDRLAYVAGVPVVTAPLEDDVVEGHPGPPAGCIRCAALHVDASLRYQRDVAEARFLLGLDPAPRGPEC